MGGKARIAELERKVVRKMQVQKVTGFLLITTFAVALLVIGKPFLIPLFLAIGIWYLINSIHRLIRMSPLVDRLVPNWMGLTISATIIILFLVLVGNLIQDNINAMLNSAPDYQLKIEQQFKRIIGFVGFTDYANFQSYLNDLNLNDYIRGFINSISGTAQNFVLILIYIIFLLIEQGTFSKKLAALRLTNERKERLRAVLNDINLAVQTYLTVKFLTSLATGVLSYAVLEIIGVDFALFWGFLIFLLNFIPTIGSIIATAFPALVALVQFDSLSPFVLVLITVISIQLFIGSFLEPRLMGNSLNISPLVIILSLVIWGYIWGVAGMLLCVPLTVILILIFAQFPSTRSIAVLLSRNGKINSTVKLGNIKRKRRSKSTNGKGRKSA